MWNNYINIMLKYGVKLIVGYILVGRGVEW